MYKFLRQSIFALASVLSVQALVIAQTAPTDPRFFNSTTGVAAPNSAPATNAKPAAAPANTAITGISTPPSTNTDYLNSDVFGAQLFSGAFSFKTTGQFNPDYVLNIGDKVQVRLWGAYTFDQALEIDNQGNVFIPNVGPVKLLGVKNKDLQATVQRALGQVYKNNVQSYASLAGAQPVRVFVTGNVNRPGMYDGTSMDGILNYLDQAGGIDLERGSFLDVQVKRGSQVRAAINLYDFLLRGEIAPVQLADGDVIFVPPQQGVIKVQGLVENAKRFEVSGDQRLSDLIALARPKPEVTHVRVTRNKGTTVSVEYFPLSDGANVAINNGDELAFTADKKPGTITVRVEGEHLSPQEYVLPYGSRFSALMSQIKPTENANLNNLQLFRVSVKQRQKALLEANLRQLEMSVLTARSASAEEAQIRKEDAEMTLQWIGRARGVEPLGQVLLGRQNLSELLLENGDRFYLPRNDQLVVVSGEVFYPNAVAFNKKLSVEDYITAVGGLTDNANDDTVILAHLDGSYTKVDIGGMFSSSATVSPGDQIIVVPKVDEKSRQFWKDMTQIIFQVAVSAKALVGL